MVCCCLEDTALNASKTTKSAPRHRHNQQIYHTFCPYIDFVSNYCCKKNSYVVSSGKIFHHVAKKSNKVSMDLEIILWQAF